MLTQSSYFDSFALMIGKLTMVDFCDICRLYSREMWLGITALKNLNLGQNSRTIRPTIILAHSAYVFQSFTFKEKCRNWFSSFGMLPGSGCTCGIICRRGWRSSEGKLFCRSTWCDLLRQLIHIGAFGWHILGKHFEGWWKDGESWTHHFTEYSEFRSDGVLSRDRALQINWSTFSTKVTQVLHNTVDLADLVSSSEILIPHVFF